jgi:hypothetical protein
MARASVLSAAMAIAGLGMGASGVAAYGAAGQPVAQIEFSANCNNPDSFLCSHVFGVGGIWVWIEVDAGGTGDIAGAECGRGAGATTSIRGEVTWFQQTGKAGARGLVIDPTNQYYIVNWGDGPTAFPVTVGHYDYRPAPGVSIQVQIAP